MTTVGKILAILNLLCSLALSALLIFLYSSRVSYADSSKKWKLDAELERADASASREETAAVNKRLAATVAEQQKTSPNVKKEDTTDIAAEKIRQEMATRDREILALKAQVDEQRKTILTEKTKSAEYNAIVIAHQLESAQSLAEKKELKKQRDDAIKANTALQLAANTANEQKVKAEIEATALRETNKDLVTRGQELAQELTRTKKALLTGNTGTGGVTVQSLSARNPPTFAVDGKVMDVRDDLVEISIGSDAGLVVGNTLDAFRVSPKPLSLGMIRLIKVDPTRSVGQVVGKSSAPLQRGDDVASKLVRN